MAQTPAGTADPVRVRHYIEIVAYCAHECAETRGGPHEVFLWNARRLAEAMLYTLAEGTEFAAQAKPLQGRPMDHAELIRKLVNQGRLPSQLSGFFDILRSAGNVGAHTHGPDNVADTATIDACRRAVIAVTRWFYYDSPRAESMPVTVSDALRDLETEQARTPRAHRTEMELRKLRREIEHLKSQLSPELSMLSSDGGERQGPQRRRAARMRLAILIGVLVLGLLVGWLAGSWSTIYDQDATASLANSPTDHGHAASAAQIPPPAGLPGGVAALPEPASAAAAPAAATEPVAPAAEQTPAAARPALLGEPESPPEIRGETGDSPWPPAAPPGERTGCPANSVAIAGRKIALTQGPNPRPNWPQPAPTPPPTALPAFCIDRDPVAAGQFAAWLQTRSDQEHRNYLQRKGNAALAGAEQLPANRVTWVEASAYCADHGGTLPSALHWEAALRQNPAPQLATDTGEWSLDAFPPEAFGYVPARRSAEHLYFKEHLGARPSSRKPLLSWQRGKAVRHGSASVSFRCIYPQ